MTVKEENDIKKEFLNGYRGISNRINMLERQLEEYRAEIENTKAMQYSDMPKGNKQTDLSDYMARLEIMGEKINDKLDEKKIKKLEIEMSIAEMDNDIESGILYKRYIQLMDWPDIASSIGYSERQTYRYHGYALQHLKIDDKIKYVSECR